MQIVKYVFQQHGDERGQLVALEEHKDIPLKLSVFTICMIQVKELQGDSMHINH